MFHSGTSLIAVLIVVWVLGWACARLIDRLRERRQRLDSIARRLKKI